MEVIVSDGQGSIFIGSTYCYLKQAHPEYSSGMRGAYVGVATKAASFAEAVAKITAELLDIDLVLVGCDDLYDVRFLEDEPSGYFKELIDLLDEFVVGYKNIDLHPLN